MTTRRSIADSTALALGLAIAMGVMYALVARLALDAFPYSGDEYSTSLQGELFARGLFKAPAPAHIELLRIDHVVIDSWVRSKYPPGAAALLAIGARHGVAWLVTPIEAVVALLLVWHTTRRLLGPRPALVALVTLGIAPLFAFNAASFYAHTPATMFLAVAFAAVASWTRSERRGWLVLAGIAIGCAFLTRPLDALLFGVAMIAFRSPRAMIITAACALPFVGLNFAYQAIQFGSPFMDGYHAYQPTLVELYGADIAANQISFVNVISGVQWWNHLDVIRALVVDWTVPGTAVVALFGAYAVGRSDPARPMRTFSIALLVTYLVALIPTIVDLDDGARPRYLSFTLVPIAFLAAAGFAPTCQAIVAKFGRHVRTVIVATAVVFGLVQFSSFLVDHIQKVWKREGVFEVTGHLPSNAIVIVRAQYPSRFARNGPFFDGVLYVSPPESVTPVDVAVAYPDRPIWEAHEGVPWTLVRVR